MRHFNYIFFSIFAALLAVSCEKPVESNKAEEKSPFSIDTSTLEFSFEGGEKELEFQAPGDWTFTSGDDSWCKVSPSSGTGDGKVTVIVEELADDQDARATKIALVCNGLTLMANVSQSSNPDAFYVVPSSVGIGPGETDFSITVFSLTREYEITIMDEWMEEVSREGDPKTGETVTFHVQANTEVNDGAPRVGVVSVCITDDSGTCVPVIVQQAGRYDPQVLAFRFTATWCGYCPYMDEAFKTEAAAEPHFEFVTIHGGGSDIVFNEGSALEKAYDISGYPTGILAGWKEIKNYTNVSTTVNSIQKALDSFVESFPCTVKPSATAKIEDGKVVVSASVNSTIDSEYSVAAVVLESDIVYPQKFYPTSGSPQTITDFVHDNIARATLTESIAGDAFEAKAGEPVEFSWSAPVDAAWNTENLSVAVWVYSGYGDLASLKAKRTFPDNYIANVCIVPVE